MDEAGISVDEACAKRAEFGSGYLADEDFARQCNPDGTVKQASQSTAFTIKNTDSSLTVNDTYLYLGAAVVVTIIALVVWTVLRRKAKPKLAK